MFQFMSKIGFIEVGSIYHNRKLNYSIQSKELVSNYSLPHFTRPKSKHQASGIKPFLKHRLSIGDFSISNSFEYSFLKHQTIDSNFKNDNNLNYDLAINYSKNNFNSSIKYNDRLSSFPLDKLTLGNSLLNFQTIEKQAISITPQKEKVFEFTVYKNFKKSKTNLLFAILTGKSNSLNLYSNQINSPFIYIEKNQLESKYLAFSTNLTKTFKNGLSVIIEPEFLTNESQGINNNNIFYSITDRYFLGLKIKNTKKNKRFNYHFHSKYSLFNFSNTLIDFNDKQEMFSVVLNGEYELIKNNLFLNLNTRNVLFLGDNKGNFTNIDLHINGKLKMFNWRFTVENILNNQKFIRKSITPLFFTSENNVVFGRYLKLSVDYKFY